MRGHIRKRGKSWVAVVYRRNPQTGKGQHVWFTHRTKQEAEARLVQVLGQLQVRGIIPTSRLKFREFWPQWLHDYAEGNVSPVTLATYSDIARVHLLPTLGEIPLQHLSPQDVQSYQSMKLKEGLSSTTVRHHVTLLHGVFRRAEIWGLIQRNPCDLVDPPRRSTKEMRVLDEEQIRLFLAEAKRASSHYGLYFLALMSGLRQGELLGLRWGDVDFLTGNASIQQTFYQMGKRGIFKDPKTSRGRRSVALPTVVIEELKQLKEAQAQTRLGLGGDYEDHDLVFCQPNGKPLRANNIVRRDFKRVLRRAGLPDIRFHDLRHAHATLLLRCGVHPKIVQERLGHSTPAFTLQVYSHVLPGLQEDAAESLARRIVGSETSSSGRISS